MIQRARKLAALFVEEGSVDEASLEPQEVKVFRLLQRSDEAKLLLRRLTFPLANPFVEKIIRLSLLMNAKEKLEDKHARMAVISALLTPLRQSVGSCFATAPLIVLQEEEPGRLLEDLYDLVTTGRLKRVIEGREFKVAMSLKTGFGDLRKRVLGPGILGELPAVRHALPEFREEASWFPCTIEEFFSHFPHDDEVKAQFKSFTEHPLLKVWEYTVASFSDFKAEFYRWNLFASLGFDHQEPGGIGEKLHSTLTFHLEEEQKKSENLREDLIVAQDQIRATEILLRNAYTEDKIRRLKVELQIREQQFFVTRELYEESVQNIEYASKFYQFLIDQFIHLFPQYFQEMYDPEMYEVKADEVYEDMPAGFRLIYKHGRYDPLVWTVIYTKEEYIESLVDFIRMVEAQLIGACDWKKGKEMIPSICTDMVHFFYEPTFLVKASERIEKLHAKHMQGVKSVVMKETPWAYSSGGSLTSLLKCYFGLKNEPASESVTPKNWQELAIFLTELVKDLPSKRVEKRLLASSSTHAFSLMPSLFRKAWEDPGNTHTWLRDHIFKPQEKFYRSILLSEREQRFLSSRLGIDVADSEDVTLEEFAKMTCLPLDGFYRDVLPLVEGDQGKLWTFKEARTLFGAQSLSLTPPEPFLFGDTNWPHFYFGILFSAASGCFDLWRLDKDGYSGAPMTSWRDVGTWTIYTTPFL